jgi:hypothetical protein
MARTISVRADFLTREVSAPGHIRFWVKPHWYSRRRCIAIFDWTTLVGIWNAPSVAEEAKELGVKI